MSRFILPMLLVSTFACGGDEQPAPGDPRRAGDAATGGDNLTGDPVAGDPAPGDAVANQVDWAILQHPANHTGQAGTSLEVFGRVFEAGVTEGAGQGSGIVGAVGVGAAGEPVASWVTTGALFNVDAGNNDEYTATITLPATPGPYRYAFRFRIDGGSWLWADLDGSDNGFDLAEAGTLVVEAPPTPLMDWARVILPAQTSSVIGGQAVAAQARVYEAGVSEGVGDGGLTVELGVGDDGTDPTSHGSWVFVAATYAGDLDSEGGSTDADDQFVGRVLAPSSVGSHDLAVRVRVASEPWLYADAGGSNSTDDLYDPAASQPITVVVLPANGAVTWCNIQWPTSPVVAAVSAVVGMAYGRVSATADPGPAATTGSTGTGPTPRSQIGVGDRDTDPASHGSWSWTAGTFNIVDGSVNDEHSATLVAPASTGDYDWVWRFSMDNGVNWTLCDIDGSTNGFSSTQAGKLTVQ